MIHRPSSVCYNVIPFERDEHFFETVINHFILGDFEMTYFGSNRFDAFELRTCNFIQEISPATRQQEIVWHVLCPTIHFSNRFSSHSCQSHGKGR